MRWFQLAVDAGAVPDGPEAAAVARRGSGGCCEAVAAQTLIKVWIAPSRRLVLFFVFTFHFLTRKLFIIVV